MYILISVTSICLTFFIYMYMYLPIQICNELNDPSLAVVRNWPSPRGTWKCVTSESAGRMFQVGQGFVDTTTLVLLTTPIISPFCQRIGRLGVITVNNIYYVHVQCRCSPTRNRYTYITGNYLLSFKTFQDLSKGSYMYNTRITCT